MAGKNKGTEHFKAKSVVCYYKKPSFMSKLLLNEAVYLHYQTESMQAPTNSQKLVDGSRILYQGELYLLQFPPYCQTSQCAD